VLGLAAAAGADVETDPTSADFAKIKVGDTRYDISAGRNPYIRAIAQMIYGHRKSTTTGEIIPMDGTKYGGDNRLTPLWRIGRSKLAPVPGSIVNAAMGKDMVGNEVTLTKEVLNNVSPFFVQTMAEIINDPTEGGGVKGAAQAAVPSIFGVSVQRYGSNPSPK
jgi:hypothetical protein